MASYMYHDLEVAGSVHIPHDMEYADQATRKAASGLESRQIGKLAVQEDDGSYWVLKDQSPTWAPFAPPAFVVGDIGKAVGIVSDGDGDIKLGAIAAGGSLQTGYDFDGPGVGRVINATDGALQVNVPNNANNPALELVNLDTTNDTVGIQMGGTSSNAGTIYYENPSTFYGMQIRTEGTPAGAGSIRTLLESYHSNPSDTTNSSEVHVHATSLAGSAFIDLVAVGGGPGPGLGSSRIYIDARTSNPGEEALIRIGGDGAATYGSKIHIGTAGPDHEIQIGNTGAGSITKLDLLAESPIKLTSSGDTIQIQDKNLPTGTWTQQYLTVSDAEAEYDTYKGLYGEASILSAINQAATKGPGSTVTFDGVYNHQSGDHSIAVDDGNVIWILGDTYGHHIVNGSDYFKVDYHGVDQLDFSALLFDASLSASNSMVLSSGGALTLKDQYLTAGVALSETGETVLETTAQSLVGGINELRNDLDVVESYSFDDLYQNESGVHAIGVDDGDVFWNLSAGYGTRVEMPGASSVPGMKLTQLNAAAPGSFQPVLKIINNNSQVDAAFSSYVVDIENNDTTGTHPSLNLSGNVRFITGFSHAASGNALQFGTISLDSNNADMTAFAGAFATGTASMFFDATTIIKIGCSNQVASATTPSLEASDISIADGGSGRLVKIATSILGGGSPHAVQIGQNADGILGNFWVMADGEIVLRPRNAHSVEIDLTNLTGTADGFEVNNGTDYFRLINAGTNLLNMNAILRDLVIGADGPNCRLNNSGGQIVIGNNSDDYDISIGASGNRTISLGSTGSNGGIDLIGPTAGTGIRVGTGTTQKVGFFGVTPVTQRLKASYNNWAALSDVVNALVALGLFDQA